MAQLGYQLFRNVLSSWAGFAVRIIISFFFVPYITSVLGDTRYGVWVIIFQTINYFALLDLGLEKALIRFLSKFHSRKDYENVNRVLNTSTVIYAGVGAAVVVGVLLTAAFLFQYFRIPSESLLAEGKAALIIVGIYAAVRFLLLPFGGSLGAFQRYDVSNAQSIAEDIIRTLLLVWLLSEGYGLAALAAVILFTGVLRQIAGAIWLKRIYPAVRLNLGLANRETARSLLGYSKISLGVTMAWLIIFGSDSLLLGLLASSAAAGVFAPAAQLMLYIRGVVNTVGTPITPTISHLEAQGNMGAVRDIYLIGLKYVGYFSFLMASGVIVFAQPFVALWLAPEFAGAATVMMILAIGLTVFLPQIIGNAVFFGTERHRYLLYVLIIEAVSKLILSFILVGPYGLAGMALATTIPQVVLYLTLYPAFLARVLKIPVGQIFVTLFKSGIPAAAFTLPAGILLSYWLEPSSWGAFILDVVLVTAIGLVPALRLFQRADLAAFKRLGSE